MRTLLSIRSQVKDDLDLWQSDFIEDSQIDRHINDSIKKAASALVRANPDYFLAETTYTTVANGNKLDLPSDIYMNKIRKMVFIDGSSTHRIDRIKNLLDAEVLDKYYDGASPTLSYTITNNASEGRKIRLFPDSGRAGEIKLWYIRNPNVLSVDTDECDIDEFDDFIVQATKVAIMLEDGDPRVQEHTQLAGMLEQDMIATASEMIVDGEDSKLDMNTDFYCEHV